MTEKRNIAADAEPSAVAIIDDDPTVRSGLENLMGSVGLNVRTFASADEFLGWELPNSPLCLILDIRMPGKNGLDFQDELLRLGRDDIPIIFITAHGDIPMSVRAMKAGAIEFLTKPFRDQDLLDAVYAGLAKSGSRREEMAASSELQGRYGALSDRERQVMEFVVHGQPSKQIALKLRLSEITVKVCRAQLMKKMGAKSLADLVRMSERLGPSRPR